MTTDSSGTRYLQDYIYIPICIILLYIGIMVSALVNLCKAYRNDSEFRKTLAGKRDQRKKIMNAWLLICAPVVFPYYLVGCLTCGYCCWPLKFIFPR